MYFLKEKIYNIFSISNTLPDSRHQKRFSEAQQQFNEEKMNIMHFTLMLKVFWACWLFQNPKQQILRIESLWYDAVFSYTLTGAVRTERTKNIVEQSDWLFESKVYCWKVVQSLWKEKQKCTQSMNSKCATFHK